MQHLYQISSETGTAKMLYHDYMQRRCRFCIYHCHQSRRNAETIGFKNIPRYIEAPHNGVRCVNGTEERGITVRCSSTRNEMGRHRSVRSETC